MLTRITKLTLAEHGPAYRATFVAVAFAVSFAIRYFGDPYFPMGFPYLTFFPAIILTAFFAGVREGIILAVLCGLASWYFFIAPRESFALDGASALALGFYIFIVTTDIFLIYVMNRALVALGEEKKRSEGLAAQRELMFHELQHRVSNNLQVVASMLKLQRRRVSDPQAGVALEEASSRVNVVARIQRSLHDPARQQVDFRKFLNEVMDDLLKASGIGGRVRHSVEVDPVPVSSDQSVPLALIATEFVSNAIEHGGRGGGELAIAVSLKDAGEGRAVLEVHDSGTGLPDGFDAAATTSLGLGIARQFAEQLGGSMVLESRDGTRARVEFPVAEDAG